LALTGDPQTKCGGPPTADSAVAAAVAAQLLQGTGELGPVWVAGDCRYCILLQRTTATAPPLLPASSLAHSPHVFGTSRFAYDLRLVTFIQITKHWSNYEKPELTL
jgi:hypothetical protein